jgi:bifunctional DNA-binding transcriptional regulator/antitoxin component of YhaV-PrlF toxin-antitoxin module
VRAALRVSPGDSVEFHLNGDGEFVLRKASVIEPAGGRATRGMPARVEAQMRRRAAELLALLRGLD